MPQLVVDQTITGEVLGLDWGLSDLLFVEFNGRKVVYALSRTDGKLVELEIASDGAVFVVQTLALGGTFEVGSIPALGMTDGAIALSGMSSSFGQFVSIGADGTLGSQYVEAAVGVLAAPLSVGDVLVSGGDGLASFRDSGAGLSWIAGLSDDGDAFLSDVSDMVAVDISGINYVAVASATEDGVTLVEVDPGGALTLADSFGTLDGLPINQPIGVKALQRLDETVLVVASAGSSSLSTLQIDATGTFWLSDHILDSSETRFQGVSSVDTLTVGDFAYVAAGGADGGVSLFTMLPEGRLVHLSTIADTSSTTLYRVSALSISHANGALQLLGGSAWETGLTQLSFDLSTQGSLLFADGGAVVGTTLNDQLVGSDLGDTLDGGAGDDIIYDGHGADVLTGGEGADLFVFALDGTEDIILDYASGTDRLDLSSFDFLYDVGQLSIISTVDGAILTFAGETLRLYSDDGASLTAADFTNTDILNVDRPALLAVHQDLVGGDGGDALNGNSGNDTISGLAGDDILSGAGGHDFIYGGEGADTLDGAAGEDTIAGNEGNDLIIGGADNDFIEGGDGGDVIYGDEIA